MGNINSVLSKVIDISFLKHSRPKDYKNYGNWQRCMQYVIPLIYIYINEQSDKHYYEHCEQKHAPNKQTDEYRQDFFPPDFDDCRLAAGGGFAALFCFTRRSSSRAELFLDWGRGLMSSKKSVKWSKYRHTIFQWKYWMLTIVFIRNLNIFEILNSSDSTFYCFICHG